MQGYATQWPVLEDSCVTKWERSGNLECRWSHIVKLMGIYGRVYRDRNAGVLLHPNAVLEFDVL